jgi:thioredoxin reductase (NADPH)
MRCDVAIVGAGPAGCAAAVQCVRLGLSVVLVDRTGAAGGLVRNAWRIENEPGTGGPLSGPDYAARLQAHVAAYDLRVVAGTVSRVTDDDGSFRLEGEGIAVDAGAVIVATGTQPVRAGIPGEADLAGRRLFYEVADALPLEPRSGLVIGGGEAAFDYALTLAGQGSDVTLLVRGESHRANARLAEAVAQEPAITVRYRTEGVLLLGSGAGMEAAVRGPGGLEKVAADVVLVAVGRLPVLPEVAAQSTDPAGDDAAFDGAEGASVLTSTPGLYIAGDARLGSLGQVGIAVGDGLECAHRAAEHLRNPEAR